MNRRIKIFDTTLRDGEQSPGCSMNANEKLKLARQLERLGVDVIEAGFAVSSRGDFESVSQICGAVKNCTIATLSRATAKDVETSAEALAAAANPRIHLFIATSDLHMRYKLQMNPEEVLSAISSSVALARNRCAEVEFSAEDASRSDPDFLSRCFEAAIRAGACVINIPDTVGYSTPSEMQNLVSYVLAHTEGADQVELSVHCHNDLGMAVANSLACISVGASQLECTINGIGERAGNAALEEIVMAISTRAQHFNAYTNIATGQLYRTSAMLSRIIGVPVPPTKAIVGANAFAHEAGIHQHGVLANRLTYEIMTPESIGIRQNTMILGKHSGRHAFEARVAELGYLLAREDLDALFLQFKDLSDRKKEITDSDLEAMIENRSQTKQHYKLLRFVINSGNTIRPTSIVHLDHESETLEAVATGDGPIYASYQAIDQMVNLPLTLLDYSIRSVSDGGDALGEVAVKVQCENRTVTGRGLSPDILESSILAYLHAVNKLISLKEAEA